MKKFYQLESLVVDGESRHQFRIPGPYKGVTTIRVVGTLTEALKCLEAEKLLSLGVTDSTNHS